MRQPASSGFSAVELLITLFIAAIIVFAGYQLYATIIKDANDARNRSVASNIAYDNLRLISSQVTQPCTAKTHSALAPAPSIPTNSGLLSPSITGSIDCPFSSSLNLSRVSVTVTYGNPAESVTHAIYK